MGIAIKSCGQVVSVATAATVLALIGAYAYYRKKRNSIPTNWIPVAKVKQLFAYPLKSGRRRELRNAEATENGICIDENNVTLRDRSFVVYGEGNNEFKTARTFPKLVLIETSVNNKGDLVFRAPGQDDLMVKIPESNTSITVTLHGKEPCEAVDCGDDAAQWLSHFITEKASGLRLGYYKTEYKRNLIRQYNRYLPAYTKLSNNSAGLYQDLTSYLLINQASIDAVKSKVEENFTANNFRPNILVEGDDLGPYTEENWDWIKIGDAIFRNVKPCTRCVFTTIDPERAEFSKKREPLKTLEGINCLKNPAHIKVEGKLPVMGIHLELCKVGRINVGDKVYVA